MPTAAVITSLVLALAPLANAEPCVSLADYDAAVAAAARTTRAHYEEALAKRKLKPAVLPLASWTPTPRRLGSDVDVVERREYQGKRAMYLLVGTTECAPDFDFVRDGTKILRVDREPQPGTVTKLAVCSCGPNVHPRPCEGGARPPMLLRGYELPAGTTFGGVIAVQSVEDRVDARFTAGRCEDRK